MKKIVNLEGYPYYINEVEPNLFYVAKEAKIEVVENRFDIQFLYDDLFFMQQHDLMRIKATQRLELLLEKIKIPLNQ